MNDKTLSIPFFYFQFTTASHIAKALDDKSIPYCWNTHFSHKQGSDLIIEDKPEIKAVVFDCINDELKMVTNIFNADAWEYVIKREYTKARMLLF